MQKKVTNYLKISKIILFFFQIAIFRVLTKSMQFDKNFMVRVRLNEVGCTLHPDKVEVCTVIIIQQKSQKINFCQSNALIR